MILRSLVVFLLAASACSAPGLPEDVRSLPSPETIGPAGTATPDGEAASGSPAAPRASGATPSPPDAAATPGAADFSGTGCFPDVPTPLELTASVIGDARAGEPVRIGIEISATSQAVVEHRRGQEFDAAVDRDGEEVWRWSTVAPLVDPYGYTHTYRPGEVRRFSAVWDGAPYEGGPPPGDYTVHGYLIGNMQDPPPRGRFICFDEHAVRLA